MTAMDVDPIVDDYLKRLGAAAAVLPPDRREELVADIRGHIDAALHEQGASELDARNVLERLGPPEDIVAAADDRDHDRPATRGWGILEIAALVVLAAGGFAVPIAGWITGVVLVLMSQAWSTREKQIGLLAPFLILYLPILALVLLSGPGMNVGPIEALMLPAIVGGGLAGLVGAIYLALRLKSKRV